jgi:hypothetical protein
MIYINGQSVAPTNLIVKDWDLLDDITPQAESQYLTIPFSSYNLSDYDYFLVVGTINMKNSDWLYLSQYTWTQSNRYFTPNSSDSRYSSITFNKDSYPILLFQKKSGTTYQAQLQNVNDVYREYFYNLADNVLFVTYDSGNKISTSSNIKIYGKKAL